MEKNCTACLYLMKKDKNKIYNQETWRIEKKVNFETYNCIYMLECKKCGKRYVGESGRMLKARLSDNRGYISNQVVAISTGDHLNL